MAVIRSLSKLLSENYINTHEGDWGEEIPFGGIAYNIELSKPLIINERQSNDVQTALDTFVDIINNTDATTKDLPEGKTAYSNGYIITGKLKEYGSDHVIKLEETPYLIPPGIYREGASIDASSLKKGLEATAILYSHSERRRKKPSTGHYNINRSKTVRFLEDTTVAIFATLDSFISGYSLNKQNGNDSLWPHPAVQLGYTRNGVFYNWGSSWSIKEWMEINKYKIFEVSAGETISLTSWGDESKANSSIRVVSTTAMYYDASKAEVLET